MLARKTSRTRSIAKGSATNQRGSSWKIEIADLSEGGCRVDDPRGGMELGRHVKLMIADTGPHLAEVAWRQGDRVGLEFLRPLPNRVFGLLAQGAWEAAQAAHREESAKIPVRRLI